MYRYPGGAAGSLRFMAHPFAGELRLDIANSNYLSDNRYVSLKAMLAFALASP
jgi:hypothetical protein